MKMTWVVEKQKNKKKKCSLVLKSSMILRSLTEGIPTLQHAHGDANFSRSAMESCRANGHSKRCCEFVSTVIQVAVVAKVHQSARGPGRGGSGFRTVEQEGEEEAVEEEVTSVQHVFFFFPSSACSHRQQAGHHG